MSHGVGALAPVDRHVDGVVEMVLDATGNCDVPLTSDRLFDGFEGRLTSSKWAAIASCSPDTALRDINELTVLGVLHKMAGGRRSTAYELHG